MPGSDDKMKCREKVGFMVVRIRFGRGPVISQRKGKNAGIAALGASLLTMLSICCASLGAWRLGEDLGWTGDFAVGSGILSHWLVWFGLAVSAQYTSAKLSRYVAESKASNAGGAELRNEPEPVPAVPVNAVRAGGGLSAF